MKSVKTTRFQITASLILFAGVSAFEVRAAGSPEPTLRSYVEKSQRRQAYGVYVKKHKFGWAIDEMKLGQWHGKDVAVSLFEMKGSFTSAGETARFEDRSRTYFSLEGNGEIVFGEETTIEDGNETSRIAERQGNEIVITSRSRTGESTRREPVPRETIQLMRQLETWLSKPPKRGATFENFSTSWNEEKIENRELISYRGRKSILWGGVRTLVELVNVNIEGMTVDFEMLADGTPIKGMMGGLFELRAEKEAIAKMPGTQPFDMLEASSIRVDKDLGDPKDLDSLTLRITGMENFPFPTSHRQRIRSRSGKTVILELSPDHRLDPAVNLSEAERNRFLKPTSAIQSDDEAFRSLARKIVEDEKGGLEKTRRLEKWVFSNVRQTMAANTSSALDVLNNRAGDCTEITLLFVTLARAAGIPAREVGGVMYANDVPPLFGWHAWAEIYDGHQWVSVDPTWNEVYVDAGHIKLSEDSNDWAWVNLLGKMKIKVVKFARQPNRDRGE